MHPEIQKIKEEIKSVCQERDRAVPADTTDSRGNPCLEWQTALIMEVKGASEGPEKPGEQVFRQTIPVQFDVSFDLGNRKIYAFLQWGRIEPQIWTDSQGRVKKKFENQGDVRVRYVNDREVVELGVLYPIQEFTFAYVYGEIVGYFAQVNQIFFAQANRNNPS